MGIGKVLLKLVSNPKLSYAALRSKGSMLRFKSYAPSKSLKTLFSDRFTYNGKKPNTVFCIDRKTGNPVQVNYEQSISKIGDTTYETYTFRDMAGNKVGSKSFSTRKTPDGYVMFHGNMENKTNDIIGIGIRGDQIQIERAIEKGITRIPREAAAQATLFHAKMGFVPISSDLIPVKSYKEAIRQMKSFDIDWNYLTEGKTKPIIVMRNGEFYLDLNRTKADANLREVIHRKKVSTEPRENFRGSQADMELSKSALKTWKKLIGDKKIAPFSK